MKMTAVEVSVFEIPIHPWTFRGSAVEKPGGQRWKWGPSTDRPVPCQVMRVRTDEGVDGVCSVGDWRNTEMRPQHLAQFRVLVIGKDPQDRARLNSKLTFVTSLTFAEPGWFGGLWDIAGKAANLPVAKLLGDARSRPPTRCGHGGVSLPILRRSLPLSAACTISQ